jgi:hypothetical protein
MKMTAQRLLIVGFLCLPITALAQASQPTGAPANPTGLQTQETPNEGFCKNDLRPEIRAFCHDLALLLSKVNKEHVSDLTALGTDFNHLDLSNSASVQSFVNATATNFALQATISSVLGDLGQKRLDQQLGANSSASGTTSLVSKAGSAELLALALNTGALTQSVNGTTATLSTNADQLFRLVTGRHPDCLLNTFKCESLGWFETDVLNPTNISATFDLAQQSSQTTTTTGQASGTTPITVSNAAIPIGAGRLSGVTARYQVRNKFDPRDSQFQKKWQALVTSDAMTSQAGEKLLNAAHDVDAIITKSAKPLDDEGRKVLLKAAQDDPTGARLMDAFHNYFSNMPQALMHDQKLATAVSQTAQYQAAYHDALQQVLDQAAGTLLTFEYSFDRPLNQPETHSIKLIYAHDFKSMGMLTVNGTVSLYGGAIPAGAKYGRVRDGQLSTEYDRTLTGQGGSIQTQLSLAGYWQYQPNPSILNIPAGTVAPGTNIPLPNGTQEFVGTAGSLWVAQVKFTVKASRGINIPLGVSWSNKTDLLQGNKIGAQVGISYNFSSLAGLFTGGGGQ